MAKVGDGEGNERGWVGRWTWAGGGGQGDEVMQSSSQHMTVSGQRKSAPFPAYGQSWAGRVGRAGRTGRAGRAGSTFVRGQG